MTDAILATSNGYRDMADGTLRLTLDIEPADAATALALFGKRGTAIGLARITPEAALGHDRQRAETPQPAPDPLPPQKLPLSLASRIALTCREQSFADFMRAKYPNSFASYERSGKADPVAQCVRNHCSVVSRSDIKVGTDAAAHWHTLQADYEHWQRTGEAA